MKHTNESGFFKTGRSEGMAAARARGKHLGRPALIKPDNYNAVCADWKTGKITAVEAYRSMGISKASFYRLVK